MHYNKQSLVNADNLIKIIKRAKFELTGIEALAFAESCRWFNELYKEIEFEVNKPNLQMNEVKDPLSQDKKSKKNK